MIIRAQYDEVYNEERAGDLRSEQNVKAKRLIRNGKNKEARFPVSQRGDGITYTIDVLDLRPWCHVKVVNLGPSVASSQRPRHLRT